MKTISTYIHGKNSQNLGTEGNFLKLVCSIYKNVRFNTIVNDERLNVFSPIVRNKTRISMLTTSMHHYTREPSLCKETKMGEGAYRLKRKLNGLLPDGMTVNAENSNSIK